MAQARFGHLTAKRVEMEDRRKAYQRRVVERFQELREYAEARRYRVELLRWTKAGY